MQTDSECESDVSSLADCSTGTLSREHLLKRIESLMQENRVLKVEVETYKLRLKAAQEEIKQLKHVSVNIQARAEQEEEFISNTLLKKIQELKKEKETLANNYEREEEYLTNDLSRKLLQLREEKQNLEQTIEQEQASQVNKLMKRIKRLEAETMTKQNTLEQLKREKIELENTLEKEQESLVNRLWKRMEKLETDKRLLQERLDQPNNDNNNVNPTSSVAATIDPSSSPVHHHLSLHDDAVPTTPTNQTHPRVIQSPRLSLPNIDHITQLRREVEKLKRELLHTQEQHREKMEHYLREERDIRNENLRLQRKLQLEVDRREQLCRQLSESESSLEMDEERQLNERIKLGGTTTSELMNTSSGTSSTCNLKQQSSTSSLPKTHVHPSSSSLYQQRVTRARTVSSPSNSSGEQQITGLSTDLLSAIGGPSSTVQNLSNRLSIPTSMSELTSSTAFQKPCTTTAQTRRQQRSLRTNIQQDHSMDEKRTGNELNGRLVLLITKKWFPNAADMTNIDYWRPASMEWGFYDPLMAGSIDGTDVEAHDRAILRAYNTKYKKPLHVNTKNTLFISRLPPTCTDTGLEQMFEKKTIKVHFIRDVVTCEPKGYAFIEMETREDVYDALNKEWRYEGHLLLVEPCYSPLVGWKPRRCGGGLGGKRESGQLRFGGRDRQFRKPYRVSEQFQQRLEQLKENVRKQEEEEERRKKKHEYETSRSKNQSKHVSPSPSSTENTHRQHKQKKAKRKRSNSYDKVSPSKKEHKKKKHKKEHRHHSHKKSGVSQISTT
ncbi:unnamed protein product [Didymodactylos carnosus]|uniref:RRM domain-containing protein n=1 Tax=Didymodactylos carnosus TaxID=1234261 RepID=A0A814B1S0_9BILA|nr:unnamed protein product [Didymodactylos carnosus]CAF0920540.1 unnamed protein product [Didymodactylos carnosus]CAF3519501.1 unnamed protein product [Didymodactylos carnosus]CAF3699857.1 unnamed protein product [Didymodactylos carnosus]